MKNKFYIENYIELIKIFVDGKKILFTIVNTLVGNHEEIWQVWGHWDINYQRLVGEFGSLTAAVNCLPFDDMRAEYQIKAVPFDYNHASCYEKQLQKEFCAKYPRCAGAWKS